MFYLQQEIFIKTKHGRAYDKVHEKKKKLARKCIICNEKFLSKQSMEEHNMQFMKKKVCHTSFVSNKKTYHLGS